MFLFAVRHLSHKDDRHASSRLRDIYIYVRGDLLQKNGMFYKVFGPTPELSGIEQAQGSRHKGAGTRFFQIENYRRRPCLKIGKT